MAKQHFYVRGTNCKSCEIIIERELKNVPGIESVSVSHKKRTIDIDAVDGHELSVERLNELLDPHGYHIGKKDRAVQEKRPINWKRVGGVLVLAAAMYILLSRLGILRFSPTAAEPAGFVGVFMIGLIASVSSCTAVVAGLVAAVSGAVAKEQEKLTRRERLTPHALFNIGRVAGFFLFGAAIGLVGGAFQPSPTLNGIFVIVVALLMLAIGVNLLELFPTPVLGMPKWLAHKVHDLAESKDKKAPIILGALTFFLPCGFTQSMQLYALSLGNPLSAGMVMAVFAFGTAPVLFGIGGLTATSSGQVLKRVTFAAGLIVLVLGASNIMNGLALLGVNPAAAFAKPDPAEALSILDGTQYIQMEVTEYATYSPGTLTVVEGVPVEWSIFGADFMGCANTLVLPAFGVNAFLAPGMNTVTFTPTKAGSYTFSCSMGMVRGTMIVLPNKS